MKKIGLGKQELVKFKEENLIYVDKTQIIHQMVTNGSYYFLSRPRRFGKSLLVSTLKELYEGNRELFEECWIHDHWDWEVQYPVLKISFTDLEYREIGLKKALDEYMDQLAASHNIQLKSTIYSAKFKELIQKLGEKKRVVILIDEYDKPIIDYFERIDKKQANENRQILKTFYTGIKDNDRFIHFLFITGVSKFSRVSIFSDLNHLTDISIADDYAGLLGYTEEEILKFYGDYLQSTADKFELSIPELVDAMRTWYDGYSWDGRTFLYNPFSVLSFLNLRSFDNFWFETGSPTFLINELKQSGKKLNTSMNRMVSKTVFNKYDIDNVNLTAIMFQTGYLTIKKHDLKSNKFVLDFPNKEVRESFLAFAVENYANSEPEEMEYIVDSLVAALQNRDVQQFFTMMSSLFSSITAKQLTKVKDYEGFYHSIIFIVLKIIGIQITCEVRTSFGATDAVIETEDTIYVVEFKMGTAQTAMEQIKQKQYYAPYLSDSRTVTLVGIGFDKSQRNLTDFLIEEIK